jgi:hypothetical protein
MTATITDTLTGESYTVNGREQCKGCDVNAYELHRMTGRTVQMGTVCVSSHTIDGQDQSFIEEIPAAQATETASAVDRMLADIAAQYDEDQWVAWMEPLFIERDDPHWFK